MASEAVSGAASELFVVLCLSAELSRLAEVIGRATYKPRVPNFFQQTKEVLLEEYRYACAVLGVPDEEVKTLDEIVGEHGIRVNRKTWEPAEFFRPVDGDAPALLWPDDVRRLMATGGDLTHVSRDALKALTEAEAEGGGAGAGGGGGRSSKKRRVSTSAPADSSDDDDDAAFE